MPKYNMGRKSSYNENELKILKKKKSNNENEIISYLRYTTTHSKNSLSSAWDSSPTSKMGGPHQLKKTFMTSPAPSTG